MAHFPNEEKVRRYYVSIAKSMVGVIPLYRKLGQILSRRDSQQVLVYFLCKRKFLFTFNVKVCRLIFVISSREPLGSQGELIGWP